MHYTKYSCITQGAAALDFGTKNSQKYQANRIIKHFTKIFVEIPNVLGEQQ